MNFLHAANALNNSVSMASDAMSKPSSTEKWIVWSVSSERADFLFGVFNAISIVGAGLAFAGVLLIFSITAVRESFANGKVADAAKAASDAAAVAYGAGERAGQAQAGVDAAQVEIARQKAIAAQAQLETERIRKELAWRSLTDLQFTALVRTLSSRPMSLSVEFVGADPEARALWKQVNGAFIRSGLNVTDVRAGMSIGGDPPVGTILTGREQDTRWMGRALSKAGLATTVREADKELTVMFGSKDRPH